MRHFITRLGGAAAAKVWTLGAATAATMNTTRTNSMGADGLTWANAPAIQDSHGNIIAITEDNAENHGFTWLNASGSTWTDSSVSEGSITRGHALYDEPNRLLHVLWSTGIGSGGIVYRRYVVSYSGNNITDIISDNGVTIGGSSTRTNVVMDDGAGLAGVEHPVLIGLPDLGGTYLAMLAVWGAGGSAAGEVRAAMIVPGANANAGQTLANWVAPVTASTTTLGANTTPATGSYSALATATVSGGNVPFLGVARQANKNLFLTYWDGTGYRWKRATWNVSNWSTGLSAATLIYNVTRAGTDAGYTSKQQLVTAPSEDASGGMYVGLASWKDNANGDTWGFARIDAAGVLTTADVKSWAGSSTTGTPSLYPTGDVMVDPATGVIVAGYITQTDARVQLYNPATLATQGASVQCFNVISDIPLLLRFRVGASGNQLGVLERDAVNTPTPPYHGRYATLPWQ